MGPFQSDAVTHVEVKDVSMSIVLYPFLFKQRSNIIEHLHTLKKPPYGIHTNFGVKKKGLK